MIQSSQNTQFPRKFLYNRKPICSHNPILKVFNRMLTLTPDSPVSSNISCFLTAMCLPSIEHWYTSVNPPPPIALVFVSGFMRLTMPDKSFSEPSGADCRTYSRSTFDVFGLVSDLSPAPQSLQMKVCGREPGTAAASFTRFSPSPRARDIGTRGRMNSYHSDLKFYFISARHILTHTRLKMTYFRDFANSASLQLSLVTAPSKRCCISSSLTTPVIICDQRSWTFSFSTAKWALDTHLRI